MKKIIKLSLVASISCLFVSNLTAGTISPVNFTKYPLPKAFTSQSRGGDLPDKIAATDGVGTLLLPSVTTNKNKIDNSAYNKLLYQNEDKLTDKINLNNLLQSKQIKVSNKDLDKINTVMGKKIKIPNGTACDDGNSNTVNDTYTNGICSGVLNTNSCLPTTDYSIPITRNCLLKRINNYCNNHSNCHSHKADTSQAALSIINANTSKITDMSNLFFFRIHFDLPIEKWDTSNVTNMSHMFYYVGLHQSLNNWNVSNVTDMSYMFLDSSFDKPLNKWNVSNVTDMFYMFGSDTSYNIFNQDISKWNVSKVTNMDRMFCHNIKFNQNISKWNVSNVTDMADMFYDAESFNQPLNKWNVSKITNHTGFSKNSALQSSYLPHFP